MSEQPSDFSPDYELSEPETAQVRDALAAAGVRTLPFGFGSALAVVSDVDGSRRDRYYGYVGQLVDRLGLDFGDSTWLQWQITNRRGRGLGFFSPDLNMGRGAPASLVDETRTFLESVSEYHKGNIDHFHAFYSNGPRVAMLRTPRAISGGRLAFDVGLCQRARPWSCAHVRIVGICVVGKIGHLLDIRSVAVKAADGTVTDAYRPTAFAAPPDERQHRLFTIAPNESDPLPRLILTKAIIVELGASSTPEDVERLVISNTFGDTVLERLDFLKERYNVELDLITAHSGLHFGNPAKGQFDDDRLEERVATFRGLLEAYYGTLRDDQGDLVFSTDADHPHSLCRVFPAISADRELRFIVPRPASGEVGFDPLNLVTPSPTRAGGGVYWARRVFPTQDGSSAKDPDEGTPKRADFTRRLSTVMTSTEHQAGLCWPIYTHLGAVPKDAAPLPVPYFDEDPLFELQDRVFNVSGRVARSARLWFARATVLYDYALILRSIAPHVSRPDANSVMITSWLDACLGKMLPRSKSQLYGLTFYVDDPARAEVRLDGERLETLVVNGPDETGRPSVTIAECDLRHILFDQLDPLANAPAQSELSHGGWAWRPAASGERAHGRLTFAPEPAEAEDPRVAMASLKIPLHGWTASGAQLVTFAMRRAGATSVALIFATRTGGRFLFGDPTLAEAGDEAITAVGEFIFPPDEGEGWRRVTVPFHDLAWSPAASPGGPLPSHPLDSLTIRCAGAPGAAVDIGEVVFLRPRTTAGSPDVSRGFCLGGRLPSFGGGQSVKALRRDLKGGSIREAAVDQRGWFCFERSEGGVYAVWAEHDGITVCDRRGRLVEVCADTMNLILDRTADPAALT
ncbi:MAG: hypothetical protein M3T55_07065 [Pseudomonadota bacterium]|nr:hypothetical protein [Pseudomonadota bacterium]